MRKILFMTLVLVMGLTGVGHAQSSQSAYKALKKFDVVGTTGTTKVKLYELWGDTKVEVEAYLESKAAKKNPQFAAELADVLKEYEKAVKFSSEGYAYKSAQQWEDVAHKKFLNTQKPK